MAVMDTGVYELKATVVHNKAVYIGTDDTVVKVTCINSPHPVRYSISLGRWPHPSLVARVVMAIESGDALPHPTLKQDVNGAFYIATGTEICGSTLKSDLERLGY